MDAFAFYKEQYYKELDRAQGISNSFGPPITILSAVVAAHYYSLKSFHFSLSFWVNFLFFLLTALSAIFLVKSVYHLIKSIANFRIGYDYYLLPGSDKLNEYKNQLHSFNNNREAAMQNIKMPDAPSLKVQNVSKSPIEQKEVSFENSTNEFDEYIVLVLIKCIMQNQKNNDEKLYQRFLCIRYLTFTIVMTSLLIIPLSLIFNGI